MSKSMLKILEESVRFYSKDPVNRRAVNEQDTCLYLQPETGQKCGVGRCVMASKMPLVADAWGGVEELIADLRDEHGLELDSVLKPSYRGYPEEFWSDIQTLHDRNQHWCETGLTLEGHSFVKSFKERIAHGWYS